MARKGDRGVGGGLLVAGTGSGAGKSVVAAGVCRWLARRGVRVAPFKAQNMSNNSAIAVGPAGAGEIGRAQAMQAAACGLAPDVRFNPVLLKPESDNRSQVVVRGRVVGQADATWFTADRSGLGQVVLDTLAELRRDYDVVVCEGAGSPAEINLRRTDFVNMGLARAAGLPVIVVGDIERGGFFAAAYGTLALLEPADQALVAGFVVNRFRGDRALLAGGIETLTRLTGRPTLGVLPWHLDVWLDAEDAVDYGRVLGHPAPPVGTQWLRVAVIRLPRISNATDAEALATEPGVAVRLTVEPGEIAGADLVVLPGSKQTVGDLDWLRERGLDRAIQAHVAAGKPLVGICGGFQMLARRIDDEVETGRRGVPGLGLLPVDIAFAPEKVLGRPTGTALGAPVSGYEIHHGYVARATSSLAPLIEQPGGPGEGAVSGPVHGTHWHGTFENDGFRRRFLTRAARLAGRHGFTAAPDTCFAAVRERSLDLLGDLIEEHLDTDALAQLIEHGAPPDLPTVTTAAR